VTRKYTTKKFISSLHEDEASMKEERFAWTQQIHNVSNWGDIFFLSNLDYMFDELEQALYKQYRKV
jgi:hypothetical protein